MKRNTAITVITATAIAAAAVPWAAAAASGQAATTTPLTVIRIQTGGYAFQASCAHVTYGPGSEVAFACKGIHQPGDTYTKPPAGLHAPELVSITPGSGAGIGVLEVRCTKLDKTSGFQNWTACKAP